MSVIIPGTNTEGKRYSNNYQGVQDARADSGGRSADGTAWASEKSALVAADMADGDDDGTITDQERKDLAPDFDHLNQDLKDLKEIKAQYGEGSQQFKDKKTTVDKEADDFSQKVAVARANTDSTDARKTEEEAKAGATERNAKTEEASGITTHDAFY